MGLCYSIEGNSLCRPPGGWVGRLRDRFSTKYLDRLSAGAWPDIPASEMTRECFARLSQSRRTNSKACLCQTHSSQRAHSRRYGPGLARNGFSRSWLACSLSGYHFLVHRRCLVSKRGKARLTSTLRGMRLRW